MATYFCPSCWRKVDEGAWRCPGCGSNLPEFSTLPYEEKLLLALNHPVREHRLMAVRLLGRIRSRRAAPLMQEMLNAEHDFYLLREVLEALAGIGTTDALKALDAARRHCSVLVRRHAEALAQARAPDGSGGTSLG